MGVVVSPTLILVRNTAATIVTADLPPFAQPGTRIDISVGAVGDSTNLQGGILVLTPLKGSDGQVYAVGQGSVITGGFVAGKGGNTKGLNHPTAGRIPDGAIVEKLAPSIAPQGHIKLQLRQADFTTAARIMTAINEKFGTRHAHPAHADNSALVSVDTPAAYSSKTVEFLSELENVLVEADRPARIVIDERTGTIVMGKEVRIAPVAILHGALTVEIQTNQNVSQPSPLVRRTNYRDAGSHGHGQRGKSKKHRAGARRKRGGTSPGADGDRINTSRHYRDIAKSKGCGGARSRSGGTLTDANAVRAALSPIGAAPAASLSAP